MVASFRKVTEQEVPTKKVAYIVGNDILVEEEPINEEYLRFERDNGEVDFVHGNNLFEYLDSLMSQPGDKVHSLRKDWMVR